MKRKAETEPNSTPFAYNLDLFRECSVEDLDEEVIRAEQQISAMKEYQKDLMRIKWTRPQSSIYYSVQIQNCKKQTKQEVFNLQNIGIKPIGLILKFIFTEQIIEVELLKKIASLCKAFWVGIYRVPFILSLTRKVEQFDIQKLDKLTKLLGIEMAGYSTNMELMKQIMHINGNSMNSLIIRNDIYEIDSNVFGQYSESFKNLKYVHSSTKKKGFDFTALESVEKFTLILNKTPESFNNNINQWIPPNLSHLCIFRLNVESGSFKTCNLLVFDHIVLCFPYTRKFPVIDRDYFRSIYLPGTGVKTCSIIWFESSSKAPNPEAILQVNHEIFGGRRRGECKCVASATYSSSLLKMAEVVDKVFNVELKMDEDGKASRSYIDEYFWVLKSFFPEMQYSYTDKYSPCFDW